MFGRGKRAHVLVAHLTPIATQVRTEHALAQPSHVVGIGFQRARRVAPLHAQVLDVAFDRGARVGHAAYAPSKRAKAAPTASAMSFKKIVPMPG